MSGYWLPPTRNQLTILLTLTEESENTTAIYDVIRTGEDLAHFWHIRPPGEEAEPLDLKLKFNGAIDPYVFRPIPAIILPGEHTIISPDWLESISEDGTILQSLQTRAARTIELVIRLPHIVTTESIYEFTHQMGILHASKLRDSLWTLQGEVKKAKQAHNKDLSALIELKSKLRAKDDTRDPEEAKLKAQITLLTKEKSELQSSLKKAKDDRDHYRSNRDANKTEVTSLQKEVSSLQTHVTKLQTQAAKDLKRMQGKDKFIDRLKAENPTNNSPNNRQIDWNTMRNNQAFKRQRNDGNSSRDLAAPNVPNRPDAKPKIDFVSVISTEIANQFRARDEETRRKELLQREQAVSAKERALLNTVQPPNAPTHYQHEYNY